jgi:hypothetical protein
MLQRSRATIGFNWTFFFRTGLILGATTLLGVASAGEDPASSWNAIAIQGTFTAGENAIVQTRALAVVQTSIHDAVNTVDPRFERYAYRGTGPKGASVDAAIAAAARNAFVGIVSVGDLPFPGFGTSDQQAAAVAFMDQEYAAVLDGIPDGPAKTDGIAIGEAAAAAMLELRSADHATDFVTYTPGTEVGQYRPTPNPIPFDPPAAADYLPAGLPGWGRVTPFVLRRSSQFEPDGPPPLASRQYARDYNEVKAIGEQHSTLRTAEQTMISRFWYENSGAGWSRIARIVAQSSGLDTWDTARLLALVHLAMADGFIGGMDTKYDFAFWRPVTSIRWEPPVNPDTEPDPNWSSLLNTPAIPDYTSTHSVLGGAASTVMRRFFRRDDVAFTTTSGIPFPGFTQSFSSFSQAATQNGESRIYAGIHFRTAVEDGIQQGTDIGRYVFTHSLRPLDRDQGEDD